MVYSSSSARVLRLTLLGIFGAALSTSGCRYGYEMFEQQGVELGLGGDAGTGGAESRGTGGESEVDPDPDPTGGQGGAESPDCVPTASDDVLCDDIDNDCDEEVDEDCVPPLPVMDSGLLVWFDGQDASTLSGVDGVSEWQDKSGNARHAAQDEEDKRPSVVPHPASGGTVLSFDGDNDSLLADNSDGGLDTPQLDILLIAAPAWTPPLGGNPSPLAIRGQGSGTTHLSLHVSGNLTNFHCWNGNAQQFAATPLVTDQFYLFEYSFDDVDVMMRKDGELIRQESRLAFGDPLQPLRVGAAQDNLEHFFGQIAEVIIYNRALSSEDRGLLQDYLEAKWGIVMQP